MTIEAKDADYINRIFLGALQRGEQYVSLDTGKAEHSLRPENMRFFENKTDAQQYSYTKRIMDNEYLEVLPVLPLQQQLDRRMELQQLTGSPGQEPKDITIDTSRILFDERARQDIFINEISQQLRDNDIKPNLKQLMENIYDDKQQFEIAAMRREAGVDTPHVIVIEQDENRAFFWAGMAPQQQKIMGYLESTVLEGTVRKEDAREIKNLLQEEKEKGNRFVSFLTEVDGLKRDDFTAFKSAFNAKEHAYENTTDRDRYVVRSIPVVEKEINNLLENKKELDKPLQNEREEKPSRGQEISR